MFNLFQTCKELAPLQVLQGQNFCFPEEVVRKLTIRMPASVM
jgi:hypothetical protein